MMFIAVLVGIFGELAGGRLIWMRVFGVSGGSRLIDKYLLQIYRSMFVWFKPIRGREWVVGSVIVH
jgi:hypothetical protein